MNPSTESATPRIDPAALRRCLGSFVTGVTVITSADASGRPIGMTVNSFSSVSLDPPLVLWSLRLSSRALPLFSAAQRFTVNILSEQQVDVSQRFASPSEKGFEDLHMEAGLGGVPMIADCAANLECRKVATYPGGDHVVYLGEVERMRHDGRSPLAFHGGQYMVVNPYELGAWAQEPEMSGVAQGETLKMARKTAEELAASSGKAVGIAVWGNRGPTMIWWVEGARPLQVNLRAGLVMPLLQSASGHLFLAFKPRASTQVLLELERGGLSDAQLDSLLDCVRTEGMASVRGNVLPDVNERSISAFSAPVFDRQADMILALTLMDYSSDFTADDAAVALLKHAAAGLSARLGYRAGAN